MADFILTTIGGSLTGTSAADNMTFGVQLVGGVAFVATGSLSGAEGNDSFFTLNNPQSQDLFFNGIQYAYGNQGNDNITLSGLFIAYGGKDNDTITDIDFASGASQQFFGNEGNDTINAGGGNDYIEGNQGNDRIFAGDGNDFVYGGKDNDSIFGQAGFDTIYGNEGNDTINGDEGSDTIYGNQQNDIINGGADSDFLQGGLGNDTIAGGGGATGGKPGDTIIGAEGQDRLTGNVVANDLAPPETVTSNAQYDDIFRYDYGPNANVGAANVDYITNFQSRAIVAVPPNTQLTDKISFAVGADAVFAGLNFNIGTTYDVNRRGGVTIPPDPAPAAIDLTGQPAVSTYTAVFELIQKAFSLGLGGLPVTSSPQASTNDRLQVYNFLINVAGEIDDPATPTIDRQFLFINNGDNAVTQADMLIQGVNVVDGFNSVTGVPPVTDIIFA